MNPARFNLSAWALAHRPFILFLVVASSLAGIYAYFTLGRAEDPSFTWKVMTIRTEWPGATAREVERLVTDPIEKKLEEVAYYDYARSYSKPGESVVLLTLKEYTPPGQVPDLWYQARKKVGDIRDTLPSGIAGPYFNDEFGDVYSFLYAFVGEDFTPKQMKKIAEEARERLLRVPGVGKIDLIATQDEKIYVEAPTGLLASYGISGEQLTQAIQHDNSVLPSGVVDAGADRIYMRVDSSFNGAAAIRSIPIEAQGHQVAIGDLAKVYQGYSDPKVATMRYRGRGAIGLGIVMAKGGNVVTLGKALAAEIGQIRASLPAGAAIASVADQSRIVQSSISEFVNSLLEAVAIVMAVSFFSLGWRTGMVVALAVPLVLCLTMVAMLALNIDLHRISLGALILALGLLVDDAIIAVEIMTVKMAQGWDRLKAGAFAYATTAFPMLTGTGVTIAGFIPVGFARSSAGEYTNALFWVVLTSLLLSWIVAVLFTPYLGYYLLPRKNPADGHREVYDTRAYRHLRSFIALCVRGRWITVAVTAAAFIAAIIGFGHVPRQFFPSSSRLELLVDIRLAAGSSYDATAAEVTKMEKILAADDRVEDWVAYTGVGSPRFFLTFDQQLQNANFAQFVVRAKGTAERDAIARDIMQRAPSEFPAANIRTGRLELGPPVGYPVQFRVSGGDPKKLREIAYQVRDVMHGNPNLTNVNLDWDELAKQVRVEIDHTKAHALGINKDFLECTLQVLLGGNVSTQYRDGTDLVDVVLRAPAEERLALKTWGELNIPIPSAHGGWVPLSQIAKVHYELEEPILWRRNRQTVMTVRADITGNAQAPTVSRQIEQELAPLRQSLPDGYRIDVGGTAEASAKGNTSVINALPLMVLVTVGMLMAQLQSFRCLLLVLLTAPLGMIGVTSALLLTGRPFGFVATLGTLALTGIIMRNSVILIDQIEQDIAAGMPRWEAIIDATVRRARPICLTAAAAILAMVPLASSAFWGPMAIAIAGGLAGATLLTLFFLPALYAVFYGVSAPSKRTHAFELPEVVLPAAAE